ncbi:hypothetical protein ACHAXA_007963 [Cyclostephanos tholiformis]|uniref:Holocytochrome c-type synthase n=1 Tax=Cyclostephanos tholiformis TaxID=382380 RepID=A0ABD3R9I6_9STRA
MGAGQSNQRSTEPPSTLTSSPFSTADDGASSPTTDPNVAKSSSSSSGGGGGGRGGGVGGGCPMKNTDGSYRIMPGFASLFGGKHPPIAAAAADKREDDGASSSPSSSKQPPRRRLYDVYSRPVPLDPTNNMPVSNPDAIARNSLPSSRQSSPLPTERVSSTIPKGNEETWTYPSPQMFYNALARKGKLDPETKEEDMASVVAIHNCMNEGTWKRILQWEKVLTGGEDGGGTGGPRLTKFLGRPTDISPKAYIKNRLFGHPLPFDRHDWTVTRTGTDGIEEDVRYVIDYYHDDAAARVDDGSGLPDLDGDVGPNGGLRSLLVDVRPAVDGPHEIWGRVVLMPLARRGCRSMLECLLYGGRGFGDRSNFEPLPLIPSNSLRESLKDSEAVWENIKKDALMRKGVGAKDCEGQACASNSSPSAKGGDKDDVGITPSSILRGEGSTVDRENVQVMSREKATKFAATYSLILSRCEKSKNALRTCDSEEECRKAYAGMTVCAGQFMCPLQHSSFVASLETESTNEEMFEARINTAMEILGECVAEFDREASVAKSQFPALFDEVVSIGRKK